MKRRNRILFLIVSVFIVGSTALCAKGMDSDRHGEGEWRGAPGMEMGPMWGDVDRLQEKLSLSDDQVAKIEAINDTFVKEHRKVRDRIEPKLDELRKVMRADKIDIEKVRKLLTDISADQVNGRILMIQHYTEVEAVLDANQKEKLRDMRDRMFDRGMGMMGPR